MDHRFLATVSETARFKPEFQHPQAVVQVNGERLEVFAVERSVRHDYPRSPLLYVLALEPLIRRLRDGTANLDLRGVLLAGCVRTKASAYADDITVFVSRRLDIKAGKKVVKRYFGVIENR